MASITMEQAKQLIEAFKTKTHKSVDGKGKVSVSYDGDMRTMFVYIGGLGFQLWLVEEMRIVDNELRVYGEGSPFYITIRG